MSKPSVPDRRLPVLLDQLEAAAGPTGPGSVGGRLASCPSREHRLPGR